MLPVLDSLDNYKMDSLDNYKILSERMNVLTIFIFPGGIEVP